MVLIADPGQTDKITGLAMQEGESIYRIGSVVEGSGRVHIR